MPDDLFLSIALNDGRKPWGKMEKRFRREVCQRLGRHKSKLDFSVIDPLCAKYKLMIVLQGFVNSGKTQYLSDYLRVSDSFRADMRALQLPAPLAGLSEDEGLHDSTVDLSVLSIPELKIFRYITKKLNNIPLQRYEGESIREALLSLARQFDPPAGLLEYFPEDKGGNGHDAL